MKIIKNDDFNMEIFLSQFYTKNLNLDDKNSLEEYFKKIFQKLENNYGIEVGGFYNIKCFYDQKYGLILNIEKEDIDYIDLYHTIDMHISIEETDFFYRINDSFTVDKIINKGLIYYYKDNYYYQIKDKLTLKEQILLLENSEIIYRNIKEIKRYGHIVLSSIL